MKRLLLTLLIVFWGALSMKALSYRDARREAWFLTDKMAYELNLTPEQSDVVYEINLDYFLSVRHPADCRGLYWRYRIEDLRYVLFHWQYNLFVTLDYFYYPIRWVRSAWYYPVCRHYRRSYYYFDRPYVYSHYRGSSWQHRSQRGISPYRNRSFNNSRGLRDRYHERSVDGNYRPRNNRELPGREMQHGNAPVRTERPSREFGNSHIETDKTSNPLRIGHSVTTPSRKDVDNRRHGIQDRPSRDVTRPSRSENRRVEHGTRQENGSRSRDVHKERPSREFGR